jgi:anti-sigma factor RsiW
MTAVDLSGVERHLEEHELVRRMDGELARAEADRVDAHLAACDRCSHALAELESLSRRFSSSVAVLDPPASHRPLAMSAGPSVSWMGSPVWRAAAAIALLAGLAFAIAPIRAWMAERLGLATDPAAESPVVVESTGVDPADEGLRIAFVPEGDRFVVRVAVAQSAGALTLAATAGDSASAEIAGSGPVAADLLVLPDGLGIRNDASSTADYRVNVPSGLTRVEVRVADRVAWSGSPGLLAEGARTLPLR